MEEAKKREGRAVGDGETPDGKVSREGAEVAFSDAVDMSAEGIEEAPKAEGAEGVKETIGQGVWQAG